MAGLTEERHAPFDGARLGRLFGAEADLRGACPGAAWPFDADEWHGWLQAQGVTGWFICLGADTIGHFALKPGANDAMRHLSWLIVASPWRGGRGRSAVALAEHVAREDCGAKVLTLNVNHWNAQARHLYAACGFDVVAHLPDKVRMSKCLHSSSQ